jgi:ATP-dependent RNA helicase HelY
MSDLVADFEASYGFDFDDFQRDGCRALLGDSSLLIAAPTGAGKTVVGEFAAWLAIQRGGRTFYTTPIKALSNQKYGDFVALHGPANVGLLTGDNSLNGDAPVVVMTTEVLRNMLYESSRDLQDLRYVVLDEVHYLQDPYRGAVWEEVLIHLPVDVRTVSLSATVSNAEEFGDWVRTLRGDTEVLIEERRPVDLRHWYMGADELLPMFVQMPDGTVRPNPRARELERRRRVGGPRGRPRRGARRTKERRARTPLRYEVIDRLRSEKMLPAIYFIFSRKGCDTAVQQCIRANISLTTSEERRRIIEYADMRVGDLSPAELDVLGYDSWIAGLSRGIAAHHAGMIPPFKEAVEELFSRGLIRAVFATETLALGINMPARTVVIESLMKFTGETHEQMTPGEYTQLSGRAGRRGIDELGHSVVLLQRYIRFDTITRLASTRTYPLRSSFQPSYNMAVNLVRNYDQEEAEHLVNSSFAQYQADTDVVRLERTRERQGAYLASYHEKMHCDLGDIESYVQARERLTRLTERGGAGGSDRRRIEEALESLRPGEVIDVEVGRRAGRYIVVEVSRRRSERKPKILGLSAERSMTRFSSNDFLAPPLPLGRIDIPGGMEVRDGQNRKRLARRLASFEAPSAGSKERPGRARGPELEEARWTVEAHPCHICPDLERHLHYAERAARLTKELASIDRRINTRTSTLARRFERVLAVLEELDYVKGWLLTDRGEALRRVYNESDLLVVEVLEQGLLTGLDAPDIASICSCLVFETRGPESQEAAPMPTASSADSFKRLHSLWKEIRNKEEEQGLDLTREPDPGFADRAYDWAAGAELDVVVGEDDAPGDFVRSVKQLIDLLRQLEAVVGDPDLGAKVREATDRLNRGVVAHSSLEV